MFSYVTLNEDNIDHEHICCAIADKKHQQGVYDKKTWLKVQFKKGHVFRKLDEKGKVFIEYTPIEQAWAPVIGENYYYIHCLWVSGKFKGHGHAKALLNSAIDDAKANKKDGLCVIVGKKKTPFLSDKKFLAHMGFNLVDEVGDYQLLALKFNASVSDPKFSDTCRAQKIMCQDLVIYSSDQCPYIANCLLQTKTYCDANGIPLTLIAVDSLEKAKAVPAVFNNWAAFYKGEFITLHLLNETYLKKMLAGD